MTPELSARESEASVGSLDPAISSTSSHVGWDVAAIASSGSCAEGGNAASLADRSCWRSSGTAHTPPGSARRPSSDAARAISIANSGLPPVIRWQPGEVGVGEPVAGPFAEDPPEWLERQRPDRQMGRFASWPGRGRSDPRRAGAVPDRDQDADPLVREAPQHE
jgi:hypothetical protein